MLQHIETEESWESDCDGVDTDDVSVCCSKPLFHNLEFGCSTGEF